MELTPLTAISPLDGRYQAKVAELRPMVSEYGLIYYRVFVEIQWLILLVENNQINDGKSLTKEEKAYLQNLTQNFNLADAEQIKTIEATTNHDVKAVEYFLQEKLKKHDTLNRFIPLIHFGCTSEDINNLSYALMFKTARNDTLIPAMQMIIDVLKQMAKENADVPMLAKTHGQPASPTTLGKELLNHVLRLERQLSQFSEAQILGKCNGAVGNFNAHCVAYPDIDWPNISEAFVTDLGLTWNAYTTQIEPHDWLAETLHCLMRFNTILIDLNRDLWGYIALHYFSQKKVEGEVGSSTMPHKINPIDFENSEGNLGMANAIAEHFSNKLPISRWQRDLSDSTVLRNLGSIFGYSLLAYQAITKGLDKLIPNKTHIQNDLDQHWEVLGEAIQTVMRRYGIPDAYEQLKAFTRGKQLDAARIKAFIDQLKIPDDAKARLHDLTPQTYTGCAVDLLKKVLL